MSGRSVLLRRAAPSLPPDVLSDTGASAEKSFTVPAGERWTLLSVRATLVSSATAGNRRVTVEANDGATPTPLVLARAQSPVDQAASLTQSYNFARGGAQEAAVSNGEISLALPSLILTAGHAVRVFDIADVDAVGDDLDAALLVERERVEV